MFFFVLFCLHIVSAVGKEIPVVVWVVSHGSVGGGVVIVAVYGDDLFLGRHHGSRITDKEEKDTPALLFLSLFLSLGIEFQISFSSF